jgi:hypothetical protein
VTNYNQPAFYGYHSVTGQPLRTQPYLHEPFDVATGLNSLPPSHEIAESMNDPYIVNEAPNWTCRESLRAPYRLTEAMDCYAVSDGHRSCSL